MALRFADMWRWQGTIDRATYGIVGVIAFFLKYFLDRLVAFESFHQNWLPWNYWIPLGPNARINSLTPAESGFGALMVLLALPFIWLGVTRCNGCATPGNRCG